MKAPKRFTAIIMITMLIMCVHSEGAEVYADTNAEAFDIEVAFWSDNEYCEHIIDGETKLGTDVKIINNAEQQKSIQPYFALYEDGRLVEAKVQAARTIAVGEEVDYSATFLLNGNNTERYVVKVFNWENDHLRPLSEAVSVSGNKTDFYGDSITDAVRIQDFGKEIGGSVNTADDVDYFKIVPQTTSSFSIKCFSTAGVVIALYDSSGTALVNNSASINYSLAAGELYYIKLSNNGTVGDYVFTIEENPPDEAAAFDVYAFDVDVNVYKNSILDICGDLYYEDVELSKQMYAEYEAILDDDAALHSLPEFLAGHPKDIENFDDLLNEYYGTKYDEFASIKQRYISLIDKYTELSDSLAVSEAAETAETIEPIGIVAGNSMPPVTQEEGSGIGTIQPGDDIQQTAVTPSLTIVSTTETSITYHATFPVSEQWGNSVYITDFNADDGLTTWENVYETDMNRANGQYTIFNLIPGGIYILSMMWSTDGENCGGENAIYRFVQLPDSSEERLSLYSGGRVTARLEAADKAEASDADFKEWLERMDETYYAYKELTGYTPHNSRKIEMKSTRDNLNDELGITDGENYYYVILGYYDETNIFKYGRVFYRGLMRRLKEDDWGWLPMHEMSHAFDSSKWDFDSETLAQFKTYYAMEQLNAKVYDCAENEWVQWYEGDEYYDYLKYNRFMESYSNSFENGTYASEGFAAVLIDIQKEIGWEPFKKTFRYFSSLSTSQVPRGDGGKLNLFLTKLKDYSGVDVLGIISSRDTAIIEDEFGITLEYVEPVYPTVSGGGSSGGGKSEVTVDKDSYSTFQFTPTESGNYYIYTSPYGGSGVSNDTYIEVYDNASLSGTPIASNDDYDGGRFSKVSVAMTEGTTYYIKVRHYSNGQLHAELNITKNVPVVALSLDGYEDIRVASGEFALYSFTPTNSMTYVFDVSNYNGGTTEYDTYIKLYGNESMTQRIGHGDNKIIANLRAGHTYYLQFSGYLMKIVRGRISVKQGQTVEFTKREDSNFIYVNSPEYIMRYDIVDDDMDIDGDGAPERNSNKIYEQTGITGENTYFQTHLSWYGANEIEAFYPQNPFYLDVDFYNESNQTVTIEINNLAYGLRYEVMGDYYKGGAYTYTLEPGKHLLLFETQNAPLSVSNAQERPTVMFDFTVSGGSVSVSSLAAYERENLYLKDGTVRTAVFNGQELGRGYPETNYSSSRPDEWDYPGKYKGTAWNESAWIDAELAFLIDENTKIGEAQPVYLQDDFYDTVANPKWSWTTALNPIDDDSYGTLSAMPGALHSFTYPSEFSGKEWHFDFLHHDLTLIDPYGSGNSVNTEVSAEAISELKAIVAQGSKQNGYAIDGAAVSLGEWGATYHYTITVSNTTANDRTAVFRCRNFNSMTFGYKLSSEEGYETTFSYGAGAGEDDWWEPVSYTVPANSIITFEVVTTLGVSFGGTNYQFVVR